MGPLKKECLTITLYVKPKSYGKTNVHLQEWNVDAQLDFIFDEMPKLYQKVCQKAKTKSIATGEYDKCELNSSSIDDLGKHIQKKHVIGSKQMVSLYKEAIYKEKTGTELCQAQLKLASSLYCFRLKDNSGS